jgi:hypothetical protein
MLVLIVFLHACSVILFVFSFPCSEIMSVRLQACSAIRHEQHIFHHAYTVILSVYLFVSSVIYLHLVLVLLYSAHPFMLVLL